MVCPSRLKSLVQRKNKNKNFENLKRSNVTGVYPGICDLAVWVQVAMPQCWFMMLFVDGNSSDVGKEYKEKC